MIQATLHHRTSYRYDRPVTLGPQLIRLRPAAHGHAAVSRYALTILPEAHLLHWQQDPHGNRLARVVVPDPLTEFRVTVDLVADLLPVNPFDFLLDEGVETRPFAYPPLLRADLAPWLATAPQGPRFEALAARFADAVMPTIDFLIALNRAVNAEVGYLRRMEPGTQAPEETLVAASGSCRDSGWLLVQLLRRLGIAARFVSGYSIQLRPEDAPADAPADDVDLHAWAEAFLPGAGWIGLDPTSGLLAGEGHVPLCAVPDYRSAVPIEGKAYGDARADFDVVMTVARTSPA